MIHIEQNQNAINDRSEIMRLNKNYSSHYTRIKTEHKL